MYDNNILFNLVLKPNQCSQIEHFSRGFSPESLYAKPSHYTIQYRN